MRHLIGAALMDLVGQRHGDGEGGEQGTACHQGNGDPSANHGQTFQKVMVGLWLTINVRML
jgi:hypothetical protein